MVAGDIACFVVQGAAWRVGKRIPDGWSPTIFVDSPLDLVRGGSGSPGEACGELEKLSHVFILPILLCYARKAQRKRSNCSAPVSSI